MKIYCCELCCFSSKLKTDYKRHLETIKHINNEHTYVAKNIKIYINDPKRPQNDPKMTPKKTIKTVKIIKFVYNNYGVSKIRCEYCDKVFTSKSHLVRHIKNSCKKVTETSENLQTLKLLKEQKKMFDHERKQLYKHIDKLLSKVGDTSITHNNNNNTNVNTNNNIQLNSYGSEDLSHLTENFKTDMLKIPYGAIPKMIEAVHFNVHKPENKNIILTNKSDNKLKIFSNNKWEYQNKETALNNLINGKYFILDNHYESICDKLKLLNFEEFRNKFDEEDTEILRKLKKESELVLLNNR